MAQSLLQYNTFGVDVKARKYISVNNTNELRDVLQQAYASEIFVLGGGSNMLLTQDLDKTVVHISFTGNAIHQVEAIGNEPTFTLNLYGETVSSRFNFDPITYQAQKF